MPRCTDFKSIISIAIFKCNARRRSECGILLPARLCLIVKRRPGYSSFSRDPYAPPGMGCETGHREKEYLRIRHVLAPWAHAQPTNSIRGRVRELENELIAIVAGTRINDNLEYTADPLLVTFSRHFCDAVASNRHSASRSQILGRREKRNSARHCIIIYWAMVHASLVHVCCH